MRLPGSLPYIRRPSPPDGSAGSMEGIDMSRYRYRPEDYGMGPRPPRARLEAAGRRWDAAARVLGLAALGFAGYGLGVLAHWAAALVA